LRRGVVDLDLVVDAGECDVDALRVGGVDEGDAAAGNGLLLAVGLWRAS